VTFHLHLDTETVDHARPSEPLCLEPKLAVREVLRRMKDHRSESVLVCRDGVLVGIFTERDVLRLLAGGEDFGVPVEQVMSSEPETVGVHETVGSAIGKMSEGGFRHLPIVDEDDHPVGILNVSTILHYLVQHFPNFIYNLPPKPHHATQQREGA